jgi:ABC-type antimicrobial peptide transport system permease subunit
MGRITDNIIREYAGVLIVEGGAVTDNSFGEPPYPLRRITKDEFSEFINIEHVEDIGLFRYNFSTTYLKSMKNVNWEDEDRVNSLGLFEKELHIGGKIIPLESSLRPIYIIGYNMSLLYLTIDEFNLEKGRLFENDNEAVISRNAISADNWSYLDLGSKIVIKNNDGIYKEFTVVGIKEQNSDDINVNRQMIYTTFESAEYFDSVADENPMRSIFNMNRILVSGRDYISMGYDMLIFLDTPDNYENLRNQMDEIGVTIQPLYPNYRIIVNLTHNMQGWSIVFTTLLTLTIIIVTIIVTNILLNSRKYEMAVLRSAGMRKSRLIASYLIENLVFIWSIALVSLIVAQFIAPLFTGRVFEGIRELVAPEMFEQLMSGANLELFLQNAGLVFGGTTAVVMLSLILACINIVRFEPLKIFNKQY